MYKTEYILDGSGGSSDKKVDSQEYVNWSEERQGSSDYDSELSESNESSFYSSSSTSSALAPALFRVPIVKLKEGEHIPTFQAMGMLKSP